MVLSDILSVLELRDLLLELNVFLLELLDILLLLLKLGIEVVSYLLYLALVFLYLYFVRLFQMGVFSFQGLNPLYETLDLFFVRLFLSVLQAKLFLQVFVFVFAQLDDGQRLSRLLLIFNHCLVVLLL